MKISFQSLSPQEALHVAIFIEERNAELYHRFAEMFVEFRDLDSLEIAGIFWDMAVEERHHSTMLQDRYSELYGNAACAITEENLQEIIELPRLEDGGVLSSSKEDRVPARERALNVALSAENQAKRFYGSLADSTDEPALKKLYRDLSEFETDHVAFLERKMAEAKENQGPGIRE